MVVEHSHQLLEDTLTVKYYQVAMGSQLVMCDFAAGDNLAVLGILAVVDNFVVMDNFVVVDNLAAGDNLVGMGTLVVVDIPAAMEILAAVQDKKLTMLVVVQHYCLVEDSQDLDKAAEHPKCK